MIGRRAIFKGFAAGGILSGMATATRAEPGGEAVATPVRSWGHRADGQRIADLGDGTFRNPILAGHRPDPTVLRDGADYYMTFSSFYSYNVFGGFLSLKIGVYSAGQGSVRLRRFSYRGLREPAGNASRPREQTPA